MPSIDDRDRQRFRDDPGDRRAFDALEETLFVAGDWAGLVEIYEHRLTAPDLQADPRARARLLLRLAQVWEERHGAPEKAAECYRSAVAADPTCRAALAELRRLAMERDQWDVALQIAEAEQGLDMASDERAALLAAVGEIWLGQLGDPEQAFEHFQRALDQQPHHAGALVGAARAAHRRGSPQDAARYWERLAEHAHGPERARALVAWAGLEAALGQPERAAELYRRALTDDPRNTDALDALTAIAEADEQWRLLADLHERRCEASEDDERRAAAALAAGRVYLDHLDDRDTARLWLQRAADLGTEDPNVYRVLADIERDHGDDAALARALERQLGCGGARPSVPALLELAALRSEFGEEEAGLTLLRQAMELSPDDALVIEALSDALTRLARWEELVDCLEHRVTLASSDPITCAAVLTELATVQEEHLADLDAARQSYERALQADPCHAGVAQRLERIYRKAESWEALRTLLEHTSRSGPREERPDSLCALGELLLDHFDDRDGAARAFENALALDGACTAAHCGRQRLAREGGDEEAVLAAFEQEASVTSDRGRLAVLVGELARIRESREEFEAALAWAERWVASAPEDPDALRLLARLHESLEQPAELLEVLGRLDPLLQSGEQAANRRRIGALHRQAGRGDEAVRAYRAALEADPGDADALRALVALLGEAGRPEELARAQQALAELVVGPERAACLDALAGLQADRLGDPAAAIDTLVRLAGTQGAPNDVEERLEGLLERTARYEELAERLHLRAAASEGEARRALEIRRARTLLEHLSLFDEAAAAFRMLLADAPGDPEAQAGLERALRAAGDTTGLAAFLAEQAESHPDAAVRDRANLERARILEQDPAGQHEAIALYRRLAHEAAALDDRIRAGERLATLLEQHGDWPALRAHWLDLLARDDADDARKLALHEQIARVSRDRLDDEAAALSHYEAAAALAPERAELWQALARLHEAAGRSEALVGVLESELAAVDDDERELRIRSRAAALCAEVLGDAERARVHYERILALDPGDATAGEFLIRRFEAEGRHEDVARVLEHRLDALDAQPRDEQGTWAAQRTSLRLRIAGLRAGSLDDPDGAIAILEPALAEVGPVAAVSEPLADLYERIGYGEDLIELCARAAGVLDAGAERGAWHARRAEALRRGGDERGAADAFRRALADRPDDADAKSALRALYRRLGEHEPLARLLDADLTHLTGPAEIPLRMELARLRMGPLRDPANALVQFRRVVHLDPGHAEALERGLELAEHLERPELVRELLDDALARPLTPTLRATLLTRRGRLLASQPDGAYEAAADYREALSLEPGRNDMRAALRHLLEETGEWEGALDCLFQEACHAEPVDRAALWAEGAERAWQHLSPEAALPWLERLRRARPRDPQVVARIAEAHRAMGRPRARLRALEDQIELTPDAISRHELEREKARLLERELDAPGRAVAALERARTLCPNELETLRQLDRLYRELGRDRERSEVIEHLAAVAHPRERVSLLCEAATLHRELANHERAAGLLLRAVAETPKTSAMYAELLRTLGDALEAFAPPDAWARCAEAELLALDPQAPVFAERRLELRRSLAASYQASGRRDDALGHLRALFDAPAPGFDTSGELEASLLDGLRAQGSWVELEQRLAARLEERPADADGWLELARLREERLAAPGPAAVAYRQLLEIDAGSLPALRGLRTAAERLGDWEEVARTLELELEHPASDSAGQRSALLQRLGDVSWHRLHSTTRASRAYAAALEADAENFAAHRALEALLEAMEDWRGAIDLYETEVVVLGAREPERRQAAWLRAGELARDHIGETHRALRAYVNAAELGTLPVARRAEQAELHRLCGDVEAFAEVYGSWCDDPEAGARSADHLRLARTLVTLGKSDAALARARKAVAHDAGDALAWDLIGRLEAERGRADAAAEAFERAADLASDADAAERLLRSALLREAEAPEQALERLRRAADADPAAGEVQAARARLAETLEAWDEAETAAARALELAEAAQLPVALQVATALVGGRAARAAGRLEAAGSFYEAALERDGSCAEAQSGVGETLFALGDLAAARPALEARLALADEDPDAALHHAQLARCLAEADAPDQALEHCEAALATEPGNEQAHALCVELHEAAGRLDPGIAALERWAADAADEAQAERLLRAASWELAAGGQLASAERHLRDALAADPSLAEAWQRLAELLWDAGRCEEARALAEEGLASGAAPGARATLTLVRARALDRAGDHRAAAAAYGEAADADARCLEAAAARARLLRAAGDWRGAADALEAFARRHPGDDPLSLSDALHQLGRLLAGPLEDLAGAIDAFRRAVELDPGQVELRATLADLLSHRPDASREALEQHGAALAMNPAHTPSLRAVLRIARERGSEAAVADGLCVLGALGLAAPTGSDPAPERPSFRVAASERMTDDLHEALRCAIRRAEREIGSALEAPAEAPAAAGDPDPVAAFRAASLEAEADLAARALLPLGNEDVADVVTCVATLALEPEAVQASGARLNALAAALGRRTRRKIKRALGETTLADVQGVDFAAWRSELRALAAARAVDESGAGLRTALVALVCAATDRSPSDIAPTSDLTNLVAACPEARELLRRTVLGWLQEL